MLLSSFSHIGVGDKLKLDNLGLYSVLDFNLLVFYAFFSIFCVAKFITIWSQKSCFSLWIWAISYMVSIEQFNHICYFAD